jgi:hypothetical protein
MNRDLKLEAIYESMSETKKKTEKCDQCQETMINGVRCHEKGCPNQKHECKGCNTKIPMNQKYCEDCK